MTTQYTDQEPMPFGEYRGIPLENVPASYLLWLADALRQTGRCPDLVVYVNANRECLELEVRDPRYRVEAT